MAKLSMNIPKGTLKKAKEEASSDDFGNVELEPNRRYNAQIVNVRSVKMKGEDRIVIDVEVPEANDGKGGKTPIIHGYDEDRLKWFLRDLAKLGYDTSAIESGDDVAEILEQLKKDKPAIRISTKAKGEYINAFIDKLMSAEGGDESEKADEPEEKEEAEEKEEKEPPKKADKAKGKAAKDEEKEEEKEEKEEAEEKEEEKEEKEEAEKEPAKEEEKTIEKGLKCKASIQGKQQKVEVLEVLEKEEKVRVKVLSDNSVYKIHYSKLSV